MLTLRRALIAPVVTALAGTAMADEPYPTEPTPTADEPVDPPPATPDSTVTLPPVPPPTIDAHGVAPTSEDGTRGSRTNKTGVFMVGAGFSSDEHFIARAAVIQPDLFRTGQRLALDARISEHLQNFVLEHDLPNVLPGLELRSELFMTRHMYPGFTRQGTGAAFTLAHRIDKANTIYGRYRIERVGMEFDHGATDKPVVMSNPADIPSSVGDGLSNLGNGTIATIGAGFVHDTLDDRFLPTRGTRYELYTDRASRKLGSDYDFQRTGGSLDIARGAGPFILRLHGAANYVHSSDPMGVPLSERLQFGGNADVRGYAIDYSTLSLGDNLSTLGRVELELPVWKRAGISIAGFADAGYSMNTDAMYGPTDGLLRRSVGFSIIWRSPLGPLRFDWAVPLDGDNGRRGRFLFGFGGSF